MIAWALRAAGLCLFVASALLAGATPAPAAQPAAPEQADVFVSGEGGYHTYRIPALVVTAKGTLLAFAEGRRASAADAGDVDVVLKRSLDGGNTWQLLQTVWDDGPNRVGDPCPVLDRETGTIWLPLTRSLGEDNESKILKGTSKGTREVWVTRSTDDGVTWSLPVNITATAKAADMTWYATGPGCGIQLRSGRLVIPCDHAVAGSGIYRSHAIYSDDHGATWRLGGIIGDKVNECQAAELADGRLLMNMRSYRGKGCRAVATSANGGLTWTASADEPALPEPVCQAAMIRMPDPHDAAKALLVFSNPASRKREKLTVRLSPDDGRTWPVAAVLNPGPSAYSSLAVLADKRIACLYERGEKSPYERITLARFTIEWLTGPHD